jgi:CheY-like chemotaxis protein
MKKINCVLLIDDDSITNFMNESIIHDLNITHSTKVLTDAEEALHFLKNGCDENCPELIFLDIKMPGMDGFEFLEELKSMMIKEKDRIKVVMLSSSLLPKEVEQSRELGAIDFIQKPLTTDKVAKIAELHFN